jgi:hypothetical protein
LSVRRGGSAAGLPTLPLAWPLVLATARTPPSGPSPWNWICGAAGAVNNGGGKQTMS